MRQRTRLSDRLKTFSTDELSVLVFTMDIAATVEPLTPEAEALLNEFVSELQARGSGVTGCCYLRSERRDACRRCGKVLVVGAEGERILLSGS